MRYFRQLIPSGSAILLLANLAIAATPATAPATRPAPDRSTPEKTWASLCTALNAGDLRAFRDSFYGSTELSRLFMDTYSDITVATFDLARATKLLGEPGKQMAKKFEAVYTETVHNGENRKADITADEARWVHLQKPAPGIPDDVIYFRLVHGQWLIDTVRTYELDTDAGSDAAEKMLDTVPKVTLLLKQIAADIRVKKITTVDQMRHRLAAEK